MADKQKYDAVRIYFRDADELEKYRKVESILVMMGVDLMDFFATTFDDYLEDFEHYLNDRTIVDSVELMSEFAKRFPGKTLSRHLIRHRRDTMWKSGEDYFSAPNGEVEKHRYDLERCLATFEEK